MKQLSHIFKEITRGSHERRFEEIFDLAQVVEQNIDVVVVSISPIVKFEKHAQPLDTVASAREPLSRDQAKAKSMQLQLSAVFNRRKSRERKSAYLNQFSVQGTPSIENLQLMNLQTLRVFDEHAHPANFKGSKKTKAVFQNKQLRTLVGSN